MKLLQTFIESQRVYLVFEILDHSLLKSMQQRTSPFRDDEVRYIMKQALDGINAVHKQGFFHRDVKPDNFLWKGSTLKIADFGLAREIRSKPPYTDYLGTRWYRAPELLIRTDRYNSPVDIWALGVMMAELYTLRPIFQGEREMDQVLKIFQVLGTPSANNWPDFPRLADKLNIKFPQYPGVDLKTVIPNACSSALHVISSMLTFDPNSRPSASELLQHEFFKGRMEPYLNPNKSELKISQSNIPTVGQTQIALDPFDNSSSAFSTGKSKLPILGKPPEKTVNFAQQEFPSISPQKGSGLINLGGSKRIGASPVKYTHGSAPVFGNSTLLDSGRQNPSNLQPMKINPEKSNSKLPDLPYRYSIIPSEDMNRPKIVSPSPH